jgi:predicted transcriptional regulator
MSDTTTVRIPTDMQNEVARIAALRGVSSGQLLGEAWREFLANHRAKLAEDLEQAADILRSGTTEDLARFLAGDVKARAQEAAEAARGATGNSSNRSERDEVAA